jgi:hypothetical protein
MLKLCLVDEMLRRPTPRGQSAIITGYIFSQGSRMLASINVSNAIKQLSGTYLVAVYPS